MSQAAAQPDVLPSTGRGTRGPSLRARLLLALGVFNLLLLLGGLALLLDFRDAELRDARLQTASLATLLTQNIEATLDRADHGLQSVATHLELQLAQGGLEKPRLRDMLEIETRLAPAVQRIGVFDADGRQVCEKNDARCLHLDIGDRAYFKQQRTAPTTSAQVVGPLTSRVDGRPAVLLVRALRTPDGAFTGVLTAVLPQDRLEAVLGPAALGPHGVASLRYADLTPLIRMPPAPVGRDGPPDSRAVPDPARAALAASPASGSYQARGTADGMDRIVVYQRLQAWPLYVVVGQATEDFLADWRRLAALSMALLLLLGLASAGLVLATDRVLRAQELTRRLYDQAPCGYHTLDAHGQFRSVNATALAWLGCPRDELIGRMGPLDFVTTEGATLFRQHFPQLREQGRIENLEFDLIGRHGQQRRVLLSATAVYDAEGRFVMSNSVMQDITPLHQARQALLAASQLQAAMLNTDLVGIARLRDRHVVWANQGMERIFGYSADEWPGMPMHRLYTDRQAYERVGAESYPLLRTGEFHRLQVQMVRKNGSRVWVDAGGMPLAPGASEIMMLLVDIDAMKRAEEDRLLSVSLQAQNDALREAERLKSELLTAMSHELRTPLNAVLGLAQLLRDQRIAEDEAKHRRFVDQIIASGQDLLGLIQNLLDYAHGEAGHLPLSPERLDPATELASLLSLHQPAAAQRQLHCHLRIDPELGTVCADRLRLRQVASQLLDNAIRFSPEGGEVLLRADAAGPAHWTLSVRDQGPGIAAADHDRIFLPLVQLSSGHTRSHGGTGIGLALARKLATAMGGSLTVDSTPGQGSRFTLRLPREPETPSADAC